METQQIRNDNFWSDEPVLEPNPAITETEYYEDESCISPKKSWFSISLSAGMMLLLVFLLTKHVAEHFVTESLGSGTAYFLVILTILIIVTLSIYWSNKDRQLREQEKAEDN